MYKASLSREEMLRTFNCGYGMVLIIKEIDLKKLTRVLKKCNQKFQVIGRLIRTKDDPKVKII